jgi:hypothetical protein
MAASTLTAYCGGMGMWSIRNADGSRNYNAKLDVRGQLITLINRRGNAVRLDGPTATEVLRAIRRHYERDLHEIYSSKKG